MHNLELTDALKDLVDQGVDGVFISSDRLTTGFIQALKQNYPDYIDKIEIAGFTNSNLINIFSPSLTAVHQPAFEMGKVATELLIKMIESKYPISEYETKVLETTLIVKQN